MTDGNGNGEIGSVNVEECCADWKPQTDLVNGPITLQSARSGGRYQYTGIPFRYCPWCGKSRSHNNGYVA